MKNFKKRIRIGFILMFCMSFLFGMTAHATTVTQTKYYVYIKGTMTFDFVPTSLVVSGARNLSVTQHEYFALLSYYNTYKTAKKVSAAEYHMPSEGKITEVRGDRYSHNYTFTGYRP